jgi:hypothetical protein
MTATVDDRVLDLGLNEVSTAASHIFIVDASSEPTTFALATTGPSSLGYKSFGAGAAFGSPTDGTNARKVTSTQISNGTIVTTGLAGWWAVTDNANSRLLAHGSLAADQAVAFGNTFTASAVRYQYPAWTRGMMRLQGARGEVEKFFAACATEHGCRPK